MEVYGDVPPRRLRVERAQANRTCDRAVLIGVGQLRRSAQRVGHGHDQSAFVCVNRHVIPLAHTDRVRHVRPGQLVPAEVRAAEDQLLIIGTESCIVAAVGINTLRGVRRTYHQTRVSVVGLREEQIVSQVCGKRVVRPGVLAGNLHVSATIGEHGGDAFALGPTPVYHAPGEPWFAGKSFAPQQKSRSSQQGRRNSEDGEILPQIKADLSNSELVVSASV